MARIEFNGQSYELVEDWRLSEQIEAENALGYGLEDAKTAAKGALVYFMSIRRVDKDTPAGALADLVLSMNVMELVPDEEEGEGDAVPPAPEPEEGNEDPEDVSGNGDSGIDARRITGHLPSATSA